PTLKPPQGGFSVEMMGFLGMGNNPMVGATVAVAVAVAESQK
ncbi:MAG: GGGtGRT protein, partial [Clostridiales bacterium]|nr:GGGtGRT protein [Clostridiales bacterium]